MILSVWLFGREAFAIRLDRDEPAEAEPEHVAHAIGFAAAELSEDR